MHIYSMCHKYVAGASWNQSEKRTKVTNERETTTTATMTTTTAATVVGDVKKETKQNKNEKRYQYETVAFSSKWKS